MSVLSLLTSAVLVGLVYGLSFLPTASLARPDDEVGLDLVDTVAMGGSECDENRV